MNENMDSLPAKEELLASVSAEQIEALNKACGQFVEAVTRAIQDIMLIIMQMAESITTALCQFPTDANEHIERMCAEVIHTYPNKRVVWLALHHKKKRVRNKNINRILKDYERGWTE